MNRPVDYHAENGIATVTLNRPEKLNAMNADLMRGAIAALEGAAADESIRVVVLTGAGRGFCAGGDLGAKNTLGTGGTDSRIGVLQDLQRSSKLLREMPKVTIAAINGPCAGGGFSWAAAADLRYAAASAKFTTAYLNAGLSGDFGGTWTLPRIVGSARARELYLLSEKFSAEEAERFGFVSKASFRTTTRSARPSDGARLPESRWRSGPTASASRWPMASCASCLTRTVVERG